jgi:Proteasome subunit
VDPSGAYFGWKASAIGKNFLNAKTFLEKRYNEEMELDDAIHTVSNTNSTKFISGSIAYNLAVVVLLLLCKLGLCLQTANHSVHSAPASEHYCNSARLL